MSIIFGTVLAALILTTLWSGALSEGENVEWVKGDVSGLEHMHFMWGSPRCDPQLCLGVMPE